MQIAATEFTITASFLTPEGDLFIQDRCCDATAKEMPPQSHFAFRVLADETGDYRVVDLPVYVP